MQHAVPAAATVYAAVDDAILEPVIAWLVDANGHITPIGVFGPISGHKGYFHRFEMGAYIGTSRRLFSLSEQVARSVA